MKPKQCLLFAFTAALSACGSGNGGASTTAPSVASTNPADGATAVPVGTSIAVTFTESMDARTVQANYNDTKCSGNVQLSSDGFSTCVRFAGGTARNENKTYTFQPLGPLVAHTTYVIRVATGAKSVTGTALAGTYIGSTGFVTAG